MAPRRLSPVLRPACMAALALVVGLGLGGCGDDQRKDLVAAPTSTPGGADEIECPDPASAARALEGWLPTYDYQGSSSPRELADVAGRVVTGRVAAVGRSDGGAWPGGGLSLELEGVETVFGPAVESTHTVLVDAAFDPEAPDIERLVGLDVMAFLFEDRATVEGLWFACGRESTAWPAMLEPSRDGWPLTPTIAQLVTLVQEPPVLVDGAVLRRSGLRTLAELGPLVSDEVRRSGTVEHRGGCLVLVDGDRSVPLVWPADTKWIGADERVELRGGATIEVGDEAEIEGRYHRAWLVRFDIGESVGEAIEACAEPEDQVLLIETIE